VITDESLKHQSRTQAAKCTTLATDNLTEVLLKILEFTHTRQKILALNLRSADKPGFTPNDLPCAEFADVLDIALDEYALTNRLLLNDTDNIKFLSGGCFEVKPVADNHAKQLLKISRERYIRLQVEKVLENTVQQQFAAQLLWEKSPTPPSYGDGPRQSSVT